MEVKYCKYHVFHTRNKVAPAISFSHVDELQSGILFSETLEQKLDYSWYLNLN